MLHLTAALDPASRVPLYQQLYRSLAGEIRSGALPAGTRMPGKRSLAEVLGVSVNTVDGAYQMLAAEGYLASRARSGFYVQEYPALPGRPEPPAAPAPAAAPAGPPVQYDLSTGGVDTRLFPFRTWARLQKELLYTSPQLLARGDPRGDIQLRQALAGLSGGVPRGALYPRPDRGGGGHRIPAQPAGPSAAGTRGGGGTRATPGPGRCWKTAAGPAG